jgi:hypothetical protein
MTAVLAGDRRAVKAELVRSYEQRVDEMLDAAASTMALRDLEAMAGREMLGQGREVLSYLFAMRSRAATEDDVAQRGLSAAEVRLRFDEDYWTTVMTTVGPVRFPLFGYRDLSSPGASVTRTPARKAVFPYHRACRSSPLCVEWEVRLGAQHPFRRAQEELSFFTHGSTTVEDTTLARHLVSVAALVDRSWMYRSPEEIRQILRDQATRDRETSRPIIYASCDAHALRCYTDDTWQVEWKMANGIRLWCEERGSGKIIHLGGEFTWGDCREVGKTFAALIAAGILPANGNYGRGLRAQLVWVSDAMGWFDEHILKLFTDVIVILDIFHLLRWFALLGAKLFGAGAKRARQLYAQAASVLGFKVKDHRAAAARRGHKKNRRRRARHAYDQDPASRFPSVCKSASGLARTLVDILDAVKVQAVAAVEDVDKVRDRLFNNVLRMDYVRYLRCGYQIGSGAMESMHRSGSQSRTKLPGARWLRATSQAVFNVRMLQLVGKWDDFWSRQNLTAELTRAFIRRPGPCLGPLVEGTPAVAA